MPAAYLFDLDGTLVDTERENAESIARVLARSGRAMTEAERRFVVGHGWREIYDLLVAGGGVALDFEALKDAAAEEKERICAAEGLRTIDGAVAFVREAARRSACAVVSGSSRREIGFCLRGLGLGEVVPWYVGAEDVREGKPSPEGYLMAARYFGIAPSDCLVFEDSAAGIASARAAGMRCIAISAANFVGADQSGAEHVIRDFTELQELADLLRPATSLAPKIVEEA